MANEIFKELKTRIALKFLEYNTWSTEAFKAEKPLKGEVWFCEVPNGNANATTAPTILFKVGDGEHTFGELKWSSALAADVYEWAKKSEADFIAWVNTVVEHPAAPVIATGNANGTIAVNGTDVAVKGLGSAAYTDAGAYATAEQGGKADNAAAAIATYGDIVTHNVSEFAPHDIDTGVHSVSIASGSSNGTVKLTVDGDENEAAVTGLGSAAYTTVDSLNETAKGYADAVLGVSTDSASANTVYGAKAAAAAAQNDATIAKTKIETFLGTVTPDGSQEIIDTLAEINSYVGEHGEEFAALSGKVTKIEDGTTVVPKAANADTLDGHDSTYFATADSVTDITKDSGKIDSKITAYDAGKNFGDIITHNVAEFATSEQGAKADTALQEVEVGTGLKVSDKSANKQTIEIDTDVVFVLNCNW